MFPQVFKGAQLLEGEEGQAGNIKSFDYVLGKAMHVKAKTEAINDEERSISLSALEGDVLKLYKSFSAKISVGDGHDLINLFSVHRDRHSDVADKTPTSENTMAAIAVDFLIQTARHLVSTCCPVWTARSSSPGFSLPNHKPQVRLIQMSTIK
ncbi:MLP-like protein 31 [Striga hermonthica]|uniref:MLP-like protein 31 n=1 Tax=Striga hermonthica TaxID=68872 RepID=A0A9N7P1X9_STRHE|nr:MLP-like protein 31 [Striga hermonthica]